MRRLRFVGLAEDGESLVVSAGDDAEPFLLPLDAALRAAVRGEQNSGQIPMVPDEPLKPKEIQARVRAGASPEQVAAESGEPVERVLRFAYPVLAERGQVVEHARRARLRREPGSPTLAEVVDERLAARGVDPAEVSWDSWKREDGTWIVAAGWRSAHVDRSAHWMFDLPGRLLAAEDDMAQHLSGERDVAFAGKLVPVTDLAAAARAAANGEHATEPIPSPPTRTSPRPDPTGPADPADALPGAGRRTAPPPPPPVEPADDDLPPPEEDDDVDRRQVRVPTWDEILLGGPRRPRA